MKMEAPRNSATTAASQTRQNVWSQQQATTHGVMQRRAADDFVFCLRLFKVGAQSSTSNVYMSYKQTVLWYERYKLEN